MAGQILLLSEKYRAFIRCDTPVEFLEGTTAAGKTTVGLYKFMLRVAASPKKLHILAADDTGAAEKMSSAKTWAFWMILVSWLSTGGTVAESIKCPILYFTLPAGIKLFL